MKVGDLFAGIGGAALAVHTVIPDAETVWQSDLVNEAVRARHFPGAAQLVGDVRALDPATLPRVDLLTAGFPCQDLSVAGKGAGLDGARSGLYSEVQRFTGAQRPERVLIENVPALLHYLPRLSADYRALGYGLTWTVCEAADAGHPHLRRRVFVLAELDRRGRGLVEVDQAGRWQPEDLRAWPTPTSRDYKSGDTPNRKGTEALSSAAGAASMGLYGRRLSPAWVEALMGYPIGWTEPTGDRIDYTPPPPVRGRYPEGWDRREPWPGFDWEPPRTLPDGAPVKGRADRLRALGNAWCPAQGALALRALLGERGQIDLF